MNRTEFIITTAIILFAAFAFASPYSFLVVRLSLELGSLPISYILTDM